MEPPTAPTRPAEDKQTVVMQIGSMLVTHPEKDIVRDAKGEIIGFLGPYGSTGSTGCQGVIGP